MSDYIHFLEKKGNAFLYRGQNKDWPLLPKIFRFGNMTYNISNLPKIERKMLKAFISDSIPFLQMNNYNDFDYLSIAQHHGMATRLLDWSANALVGLYFAISMLPESYQSIIDCPSNRLTDGYEEILLNRKYFPNTFFEELNIIKTNIPHEIYYKILSIISDSPMEFIRQYRMSSEGAKNCGIAVISKLINIIENIPNINEYKELDESEYELLISKKNVGYSVIWLIEIDKINILDSNATQDPFNVDKTYFFKPPSLNNRIIAQSGWMSILSLNINNNEILPICGDEYIGNNLIKLIIPEPKLLEFRTGLNVCGIDSKLLFPDLDGLCATINWRSYFSFTK